MSHCKKWYYRVSQYHQSHNRISLTLLCTYISSGIGVAHWCIILYWDKYVSTARNNICIFTQNGNRKICSSIIMSRFAKYHRFLWFSEMKICWDKIVPEKYCSDSKNITVFVLGIIFYIEIYRDKSVPPKNKVGQKCPRRKKWRET